MTSVDIASSDDSGNPVSEITYVYVIAAGNEAVKIGVASNVQRRIKALQTGHHQKLVVAHAIPFACRREAYAVECRTHRFLKEKLMEGEWFATTPHEAKQGVEQSVRVLHQERLRQQEALKTMRVHTSPVWIEAPPWVHNAMDAMSFVTQLENIEGKNEYLIDLGDSVIFIAYRIDSKTGEAFLFANDVTSWYIKEEESAA